MYYMYLYVLCRIYNIWLVVEHPSEKYEFASWDDFSQDMEKVIKMFQTTNQICI